MKVPKEQVKEFMSKEERYKKNGDRLIRAGDIAKHIDTIHREGVLEEIKRQSLLETQKFFSLDEKGRRFLREDACVVVPCSICGSGREQAKHVISVNGFTHMRCQVCHNIYVSPRLKDEFIWEQYSRPSSTYMYQNLIESTLQFRKEVIANGKFKWVKKRLRNPEAHSLLDIGSGLGENLAVYKENGWDVTGIEFNEYAAQRSRELFGVPVMSIPIEKAKLPRNHFDLITLWGVLEHLTEPVKLLKEAAGYLAPRGVIVIMVPQYDCLLTRYLEDYPEDADRLLDGSKHLTVFTRQGIEYLARSLRLEIVDIASRGIDIATILRYVSAEKNTRLFQLLKKQLPILQKGIEEMGFGDHLWVMLSNPAAS